MKGKKNYHRLRKNVLNELADAFSSIQDTYKYLKKLNKHNVKVLGAAEWILDNTYLVEREYKCVKKEMPLDYFKGLPSDRTFPRIFNVAKNYINVSRNIYIENMEEYINRLQGGKNEKAFTMGELWAFPLMLKAALIINLSKYTYELREIQKRCLSKKAADSEKITSKQNNVENKVYAKNENIQTHNNQDEHYRDEERNNLIEKSISEYITCIRQIEAINWKDFFKKTSIVEKVLENDPVNVYKSMDFESQDYYRHKIEEIAHVTKRSEVEVADNALKLSEKNYINNGENYKSHIGYYLIDSGTSELDGFYYTFGAVITEGAFLGINLGSTALISFLIIYIYMVFNVFYTRKELAIAFILVFISVNEVVVGLINWIESKFIQIRRVPKLDFSKGIPYDCKTVVVIPAIVDSKEKVQSLMEKLEVEYCGNMDDNIFYALLSDFPDSNKETEPHEKDIIDFSLDLVRKLNEKYSKYNNTKKGDRFYFLSRKRIFDPKQKVYMGKERKRGKLMEFMALIRGEEEHTYDVISSDISPLKNVKYLITLDEDTFMPRETVYKLVGAMSHILNIPHIKKDRIIRGYGIMQPKVSISLEAKNKTYFSKIFAGNNSVDGYSVAYSDTYEDLFGEGTFVGKGIINIDEFYGRLKNTIKEDRILSHDLLEGALCRCALLSDIEFIDDYPSFYESSCKRLHRWVRGDWQLIGWIFSRKISVLNKWKIIDNLRRSLLAPNLMVSLILSLTIFNGNLQITLLCFLALVMSLVFTVADFVVTPKNKLMGTFKTLKQIFLIISFIPYQAFLMIDAIMITLIRMLITRKNLLEWKSSQFVEKNCSNTLKAYIKRMWISPVMAVVVVLLSLDNSFGIFAYTVVTACLWLVSPYIAYAVSCDIPEKKYVINYEQKTYLREISRRIYAYYEDFINEENNYLPPDNYQVRPYKGVAHRTSPTNMGMGIIAEVAAYDLGYITLGEFIDKVDSIITNMSDLKREQGHFYNWYDTRTKEPLWPRYISTVDSGNLLANLWILKKSMEELKNNPVIRTKEIMALKDIYKIIEKEYSNVKVRFASSVSIDQYTEILEDIIEAINKSDAIKNIIDENSKYKKHIDDSKVIEEARYWIKKLIHEAENKKEFFEYMFLGAEALFKDEFIERVPNLEELKEKYEKYKNEYGDNFERSVASKIDFIESYLKKIDKIINYVDDITKSMNFKFLYDEKRELFSIGYNVEEKSLGSSYYDLLASESRIASFVAIAKNDVPKEHWFKLSRAMTNAFHSHTLVSWSGTMFEYFMPSLMMKAYSDTLLKRTYKEVIKAQRVFAKQKKIPWGISECAFYEFDNDENYQYKAFGIPGLGLKRGLEDEIVVSPYSTLMSLPFSKKRGFTNLNTLEEIGLLGRYGFIEAVDYTKARKDKIIFTKACIPYTQNVDNYGKNVYNYKEAVDNSGSKYESLSVNNIDKNNEMNRNEEITSFGGGEKVSDNPQKNKIIDKEHKAESYPQEEDSVFEDGIRPNKIMTYMVHHLGMSIMGLENMLLDNILVKRFHSIPQVKATELLLKERIPEHVTYERHEDYTIKNNYIEGQPLLTRSIENTKNKSIVLLSNAEYSIMLNSLGSGYSSLKDMMLYRWKGDSTSDSSGMFFYIKNLNSNEYWSASFEPCKTYGDEYNVNLNIDKPQFNRKDGNIETTTQVSVSYDENFEVRKITLKNNGLKGRSIEITSYMEIVLTSFSADAVHPAFSNLFVQTEYDEEQKVVIGSRRGRVKDAKVPYIYHKVVCDSKLEGNITYETSRINFIGRNRTLKNPQVMDNDKSLENTVGTVLDPVISLRARVRLEAQEEKELYFITGISDSKEDALEICRTNDKGFKLERLFDKYHNSVQLELRNLEITPAEANAFQDLASDIFYLSENRKNRENYIKNISKHQKDLWAFGISGDIPIMLIVIDDEKDISLIIQVLKFHYYMRNKGVKIDLVIYNDEELSYDEPLQKSLMSAINTCKEGDMVNKPAGIHLYNKSTMNNEMRDFLIGICRIYVNSKNGSLISQIAKNIKSKTDREENSYIPAIKDNVTAININYDNKYGSEHESLDESHDSSLDIIKDINILENNDDKYDIQRESSDVYNQYDHDVDFLDNYDINEGMHNVENEKVVLDNEVVKKTEHQCDTNIIEKEDEYKTENLDFFNGYGGFSKIDGSYIIKLSDYKNTPAPWINVMSNEDFGFHISESGSSYTWCGNSRENKITPWSNDYITDPLGEALYIKDDSSGNYFSISPKPVRDSGEYIIKHGFGYSEFIHSAYDIKGRLEVFVPRNEKVKIQKVTLENLSNEGKEISLFYYAKMVLGVYEYDSSKYITTEIKGLDEIKNNQESSTESSVTYTENNLNGISNMNTEVKYITANNPYSEYFGNLYAYLTLLGGNKLKFTGDAREFIGNNGELSSPEILRTNNDLSNRSGSIYDPCLAASTKIFIPKGQRVELIILLGQDEKTNISKVIRKYTVLNNAQKELEKVKEYWHDFLGKIQVKTPSKSINYLLNGWLLYQTYSCRYLSRSAFYQSGGAYGFRDQLQDSMALGVVQPEITKDQILRSASRQYVEGDVQHWWHPVVNSGIRTRFSDDLLWLPYVTAEYINSTGDYEILEKTASYLEDEPLKEGEDERYTIVNSSAQKGTIYEHCLKAIEKSLKFGPHNIPLMGSGDWNDGMSTVGNKGKGESIWLGWFIYSILDKFIKISEYKNDIETKNNFNEKKKFIKENIEKNAWDGGWYRRAYFDDGTPLGSRENPECQIDSIAQSWSVISGAARNECSSNKLNYTERAIEALEAVDKNLVKVDRGMILLLAPPFNNSYLEPGYIKGYVPGVRENGGQYTHAAVWVILALTKLGLGDKAVKYYDMINPINHTKTELECMTYKLEPYVMAADVYIKEPHGGRGGWSWYTGASGWMYKVGIENILGLRRVEDKGYVVDPCVPKSWDNYEIRIKNKTEDYLIHVKRRTAEASMKEKDIIINLINNSKKEEVILENNLIPRNLGKAEITVYFE
ncbi:glucoamylase family protein [Clostridium sp. SM-530-WT-3G]|uniref:GH36-type glycosyl hydrolase domain-containing protein n=1 Tax=Clostridium sp. SM-530-WT-3G TaxID=2725303 RepID=UPI00145D3D94|nr:glucoamylase family protein [Clostridium sp. SM-530-WT-3G]NME83091.1 glycosyl transferase [Clostridium sp. SM-530-WT-3G]